MCKKLFVRTPRVLWLAAFVIGWMMTAYGSPAIGQEVVGVDDPSDMADSSGDIKRVEAWVEDGNLNLTMSVYGIVAPSVEETPEGMSNRYYYHWLLDTDNDPATGFSNAEYEGNATGLETPIGADVVVMFGWRDGATNGVEAYDPLTEDVLLEDFECTIDGDTIHAVVPLADLGLTSDDTIAVSAFQEGASNDWQCDWVESAVLPLAVAEPEPVNPGDAGLLLYYDFEADVNDMSGNGNDGTLLGDAVVMDGLLALDGDDDAVAIPRIGGEDAVYGQTSYAMWVYPTADMVPLQFAGGMNTSPWGAGAVHLKLNYGVINVGINGLDGGDLAGTTVVDPNTWNHLALTISDTQVALYLNGQLEDSRDLAAPLENLVLGGATLGAWENGDVQREMPGYMDDVYVYDRGLSAGEVQWLAGWRPTAVDPGTEGLVAYYPLDNDANDASGNGLDGTIMGDPSFVEGAVGMALQLDGVDDYVDCGNDPIFDITEQVTLSAWVNVYDIGNGENDPWVGKGDTAYMLKGHRSNNEIEFFVVMNGSWNTAHADVGASFNGEWHHAAGTFDGKQLKIYVDGALAVTSDYEGPIATNSYNVAIGTNTEASGRFSEGAHDEVMIYNRALSAGEIMYLAGYRADVTIPGDAIQGVPNDGVTTGSQDFGWPEAEYPALAIDDDVATKFLHFKGELEPTGIQVTPAVGATLVTGLTFTTANDATERDPITFELSGSNDGIDGPYTLIASGLIVDFAQEEAWPRFTMNETPIVFYNTTAYTNYQLMITTVRDPGSANSMQIAEIGLVGKPVQ